MPKQSNSIVVGMPFTAIDLFCGAGGFSLGLERAGYDILLGVDSWKLAVESYAKNFSHPVICADINSISGQEILRQVKRSKGNIDLVVGGPPCQGFSIQRIGSNHDMRNNLVMEYARLICEIFPRYFVMENVLGLVGERGKNLFQKFLTAVHNAGYDVETNTVNAADYGVPQLRRRIVVLGWRRDDSTGFRLPAPSVDANSYRTVQQAIGDLPIPPSEVHGLGDPLHKQTRLSAINKERLRHIPPGGGMQDLPVRLRVNCHKAGADKIGHRFVYGRLAPNRPAGTITARFDSFTRGRFAHPFQDRNITLREGARLQTFPDTFRFSGNQEDVAAQIGNAVPPMLAEMISRAAVMAIAHKPQGRNVESKRPGNQIRRKTGARR